MKSIAILTARFFDPDGTRIIFGGAERYLVDLVYLLKEMGYYPRVYQGGSHEWLRNYDQMEVVSLITSPSEYDMYPRLNYNFHEHTAEFDYRLYFSFNMCYPYADPGSLAISHGIWWDSAIMDYWRTPEWRRRIEACLAAPHRVISVDTNTINWVRAEFPQLGDKMIYLPNYVDINLFRPQVKEGSRFSVLFPRSLVDARGFMEAQFAAGILLPRYPDMEFHFVGRGSQAAEDNMARWARESSRVSYYWLDMKDMPEAYNKSDLVLIPSKYAEGTSLSALEALACGKVVLAGCTGGLTDIIIDAYNGFFVQVTAQALAAKVEELYHNRGLRQSIADRARETALPFSRDRWREKWKRLIRDTYPL